MLKRSLAQLGFEHINCIMALWGTGHTPQDSSQTRPIRASNGRFAGGEYYYRKNDECIQDLEAWGYIEFIDDDTLIITSEANEIPLNAYAERSVRLNSKQSENRK